MAKAKPHINTSRVLKFLQETFDKSASNVLPIHEGVTSAAFFFSTSGKEYVIRIGGNLEFFERDKFAGDFFASPFIPIPKIIALGEFERDIYYAISEKIDGNLFFTFKGKEFDKVFPHFITTLDAIHATDIHKYSGYGDWDKNGNGFHRSWKIFLESICSEDYFGWQNVFTQTFFYKSTFDLLYEKFLSLLDYCPEERYLIHGDYGVNNVLAKKDTITGVLDWGLSKYGDFLYDVAWVDFWGGQVAFGEVFFKHYKEKGVNIEHYSERLLCYKLHFVIASLHFAATSKNKKMYEYTLERVLKQIRKV